MPDTTPRFFRINGELRRWIEHDIPRGDAEQEQQPMTDTTKLHPGDAIVEQIGEVTLRDGRTIIGAVLSFPSGPGDIPLSVVLDRTPMRLVEAAEVRRVQTIVAEELQRVTEQALASPEWDWARPPKHVKVWETLAAVVWGVKNPGVEP